MNAPDVIAARREEVSQDYKSAVARNLRRFKEKDDKATAEYIFPNQQIDANEIVREFYENNRRVISITKKTKVGMDGLMIEIVKLMATHSDDDFVVNPQNVRILTGMSNVSWAKDMIDKVPQCFKDKIFHHGQLSKSDLDNMRNGLIIIDEIDSGDKEEQVLHNTLKDAGVLNVTHMKEHNNRFVFASATMIKQLYELYKWGDLHYLFKMTIPDTYFGHSDFLARGIIQEFYSLGTTADAEKWIREDVLSYETDYRIHIVRVNPKTVQHVQDACIRYGVTFRKHTSADRLTEDEINEFFKHPLTRHIVLAIKGFFRRANLIPNSWKLRIGATHEHYVNNDTLDFNVQIQGLPGRMTGYWRSEIEGGHRTGPHRTSIRAVTEYEKSYTDPFGKNSYQTAEFKKNKNGKVSSGNVMLSPKNILNLTPVPLPLAPIDKKSQKIVILPLTPVYKTRIEASIGKSTELLKLLEELSPDVYNQYKSYELRCWQMNTAIKCKKWGLDRMLKPDAYSTETNIGDDKTKNVLVMYYHENSLLLNPWNGAA